MTVEPDYHGRPAKPKERFSRLLINDRICQSSCRNTMAIRFWNRADLVRTQNYSPPPSGRPENCACSNDQVKDQIPDPTSSRRQPGNDFPPIPYFDFAGRPWQSCLAVVREYKRTDKSNGEPPKKHGEIWIKIVNKGDLWSRTKQSKRQHNIGAGKEIILLIYEHNVSHSSWYDSIRQYDRMIQ